MIKRSEYELKTVAVPLEQGLIVSCQGCIFSLLDTPVPEGATCLIAKLRKDNRSEALERLRLLDMSNDELEAFNHRNDLADKALAKYNCRGPHKDDVVIVLAHKLSGATVSPEEIVAHHRDKSHD